MMNHARAVLKLTTYLLFSLIFLICAKPVQAAIGCYECHGSKSPIDYRPIDSSSRDIQTGGFPGNHRRHVTPPGAPASCEPCHPGSSFYTSSHRDGKVKVGSNINSSPVAARYKNTTSAFPQTSTPSPGTCTNVNCHFEATTPPWGSAPFSGTGDCAKCHAAPPNDGTHAAHDNYYGPGAASCGKCHADHYAEAAPFAHASSAGKRALVLKGFGYSKSTNTSYPYYLPSQTPAANRNGTCSNISCHGNTSATWGGTANAACLDCHSVAQGSRAAITSQFGANSHHIQGTVTNAHCYQCHWEANSDGSINTAYHHSSTHGAPVELVVYGAGARPSSYNVGTTAIQYTANGSRSEMAKLNSHCLGCHSDQNNSTQPFGDGKTPRQYAWDATSVAARYGQTGSTTWGKYSSVANASQKRVSKAYSAHGNATANKRGWDTVNGLDGAMPNTSGTANVLCYDCHNSHGSTVTGTTTRYASATTNGGILKDTTVSQNGYSVAYKPYTGGSALHKNRRNPGASLCLDCHMNQNATTTPWGYTATFGATQPILGYWDSPYMDRSSGAGSIQRYSYKGLNSTMGGHFGATYPLGTPAQSSINGLCTPCHDPHGVSPTLGANQQYAVPLLKGTWLTSPYKEDVAPANNAQYTGVPGYEGVQYHIDQTTFASGSVTENENQAEGLCLGCHPKSSLTATASPANPNAWKSKARIHESVKGWKTSNTTVKHSYTCSKCHSPHNDTILPRLMVTNCMDSQHKGRSGYNPYAITSGSASGDSGSGSGRIPGYYNSSGWGDYPQGPNPGYNGLSCHESATANGGDGTNQSWNLVTPWIDSTPTAATGDLRVLLHLDEASWNGTPNEVRDSSGGNNNGTAYNGANTVAGGVSGRAGSFNGSNYVAINYLSGVPPMDNFTIEAWVKPTTTHEIDPETSSGTGGTYGEKYLFWPDQRGPVNGGAGISVGTNGISVYEHGDGYMPALAVYSGTISPSSWTHIAVVYLNKRPSIYVNGVLVRTGLQSSRAHVYASQMIGWGTYGGYAGQVDEIAIYDSALSSGDIQLHSQQTCIGASAAVTVRWNSAVPATSYVDYGLTASYGSTVGNDTMVTSHSITLSNLTNHTAYHYRVRSTNASGIETVSDDYTFTAETCIISTVSTPVPTHQSDSYSSGGSVAKTFQWGAATANDNDPVQYLVEVSSASNFATINYNSGWISALNWTQSLPVGTWYWRVTARDSVHTGNISIPSSTDSFSIIPQAPPAPTLTPQGTSYVIGSSATAAIAFQWSAVSAPDSDVPQYLVEVSSNSSFTAINYQSTWQSGTNWTQSLPIGTWYWRVTARDSVHTLAVSSPSSTSSFAVRDRTPAATTLTSQGTGYVIGSGATAAIAFQWSSVSAPDGDTVQYQVDVSSSSIFSTIAYQSSWQSGTSWSQSLPVGTWYWRVKTRDSVHTTAISTSASNNFAIIDRTPAAPVLVHNPGAYTNGATITFQWNTVSSKDGDTIQYWVDVSAVANFSTIAYSTPAWQTGTSWSQTLPAGTWYWRAKARDSVHTTAVSAYSASDSFNIALAAAFTTPGTYTWTVPTGVTSVTATVKGAGGGGGLTDNVYNQEAGANGDLVSRTLAVTPGSQLTIYVAGGGSFSTNYDTSGGPGGTGYHNGSPGGNGDGYGGAWAYGGSGGGGSSAITLVSTLLAEAAGGAGGRSSDYDDSEYCYEDCGYYYGGSGGAGGGSDYPAVTTIGGGGTGGGYGQNGAGGSVVISY